VQQAEAEKRLEYGSEYLRRGTPSDIAGWVPREGPLTQSLQELEKAIKDARGSLKDGDKQAGASEMDRQVASLERTRAQLERALAQQGQQGQGKQGGQQQGQGQQGQQGQDGQQGQQGQGQQGQQGQGQQGQQGQQGKGGQQGGGQQGGGQQGGNQNGSNQFGGGNNGGAYNGGNYGATNGGYDRFGRYNPQGLYDPRNGTPVDPRQVIRDAQRDVAQLRQSQSLRDNRDLSSQASALEKELQDLTFGNPSGPELQDRLSRQILPQLESLEVGLRQELAKPEGQVRSASTDRTPVGFGDAVQEYFRKLSRSK
jgi:hypothetical protein